MRESADEEHQDFLSVECSHFDSKRTELLLQYPNRVLLIHGEELVGDFANEDDAICEGVRRFGTKPFLVRRSGEKQLTLTAPALTLGILKSQQQ